MTRSTWIRFRPEIAVDAAEIEAILDGALPGARVLASAPVAGGLANTNIDVTLAAPPFRVVLRIYQRDPAHAAKEVALASRLQGHVAAPAVLHFTPENPVTGHPCAVMAWHPGVRLETLPPTPELGHAIGTALASIHAIGFPAHGFFGQDLVVHEPMDVGRAGLLAYLRSQLTHGPGETRLGAGLTARLMALVEREGHLLDTWVGRPCLVHGDFNGSNILVDGNAVSAIVDWEFAFSGSPATDFGNLLRPPMNDPAFTGALAEAYLAAGGFMPANWRRVAELADIYSWADFLGRPAPSEPLLDDARAAIQAVLR